MQKEIKEKIIEINPRSRKPSLKIKGQFNHLRKSNEVPECL